MSNRLSKGGDLINRNKRLDFSFDGKKLYGFEGDTLASALLANGQNLVGRSFKYHRPRGIVASGVEEPNALVSLGTGPEFEPNQRATVVELYNGLVSRSQNRWPSLKFDMGATISLLGSIFSAGFYYKTFIYPRAAWKHIFEPLIRHTAGLGKAPRYADPDRYEHFYCHTDVLIVGGGASGLIAAKLIGMSGAKTLLLEQSPHIGGRCLIDKVKIDGKDSRRWVEDLADEISKIDNVTMKRRTVCSGIYDHGFVIGYERVNDHQPNPGSIRHRLWKIRAKKIIVATGSIERPLVFPGNDLPGVMLASAVRDYASLYGVSSGDRTVLITNNDNAYKTAIQLKSLGLSVPAILDIREESNGPLVQEAKNLGISVRNSKGISKVIGSGTVKGVRICSQNGEGTTEETIECETIAMSGGWSPAVHLWSHCGGKLDWDEKRGIFFPKLDISPIDDKGQKFIFPVGGVLGKSSTKECLETSAAATLEISKMLGFRDVSIDLPNISEPAENSVEPVWLIPAGAGSRLKSQSFLDYQNDVKVSDIKQAVLEGYESVEHAKRYTTLGMATDQGKLSNVNGHALLAHHLGKSVPKVGTTTFRPPYTPISLGSIAGDARGALFKATRKTAIDSWSEQNGAHWEPVADWRRPYVYLRKGETIDTAVTREILNTRTNVGILDASTLGKIMVKGPDAGKFLDLIYTNIISTLKIGQCRYGLMCNENGFLFDDGVVVRINNDTFICHTTSGGSDRVYSWMEEWLQTEWWKLDVFITNITEQFAQICLAGPNAKTVIEEVFEKRFPSHEFAFMRCLPVTFAGQNANIYRISFSGELSFEIAVPNKLGLSFWKRCMEVGENYGIQPYGTEALHVMRAEKGFIMIGDETDGTVTPQDLNLGWAVSKKKTDFLGKRAQARSFLTASNRKKLVGLSTLDKNLILPDGAHIITGVANSSTPEIIGHVTSTYFSPTLGRSIALALIEGGLDRLGDLIDLSVADSEIIKAKVVDPVFYDPEGDKQNV